MKVASAVALSALLSFASFQARAELSGELVQRVEVKGKVSRPGQLDIAVAPRFADAIVSAEPAQDAYLTGTKLFRQSARPDQIRLRAGLLHTLSLLQQGPTTETANLAHSLSRWLKEHEATGVVAHGLDARLAQVQPRLNVVLEPGDQIIVPARPSSVRVMGAVLAECTLAHEPLRDAQAYLRSCPSSPSADRNYLLVIQPDGKIQRLGRALWNRADSQPIAPGGTLYVPVAETVVGRVDAHFNSEFAMFIATQPIY